MAPVKLNNASAPLLSARAGASETHAPIRPQKDWENPKVYQRNRLGSHAPLQSHTQSSQALSRYTGDAQQSSLDNVLQLSGTRWRFNLFEKPEDVTPDFASPAFKSADWKQVSHANRRCERDCLRWPKITTDHLPACLCRSMSQATGNAKDLVRPFTPTLSTLFLSHPRSFPRKTQLGVTSTHSISPNTG